MSAAQWLVVAIGTISAIVMAFAIAIFLMGPIIS